MKGVQKLSKNIGAIKANDFLKAANAYAKQQNESGIPARVISAEKAPSEYKSLIRSAVALANPMAKSHNEAFNSIKDELGSATAPGVIEMEEIGNRFGKQILAMVGKMVEAGMGESEAREAAFNSVAGNPVFDHFANLQLLGAQPFEDMTLVRTWMENGDSFAVPTEPGGTGTALSRFRAPVEQITGSAKIYQGDINPTSHLREDANRIQANLYNEFKDVKTIESVFTIDQDQRNQALGYQKAVDPALAGFILQNRYFNAAQMHDQKLYEAMFADGLDPVGTFVPGVGGGYGLLSPAIRWHKTDWNTAVPSAASAADWRAAQQVSTAVQLQTIQNFYATGNGAAPLLTSLDPGLYYRDIVRLLSMFAQTNVDWKAKKIGLIVPTTFYTIANMFPGIQTGAPAGQGVFNRNLRQMVQEATGHMVPEIEIIYSSLFNNRAANMYGNTGSPYNYMMAVALGAEQERKPIIMPGQTAAPYVITENVSSELMVFRSKWTIGGPMFIHWNGAFLMEFSE